MQEESVKIFANNKSHFLLADDSCCLLGVLPYHLSHLRLTAGKQTGPVCYYYGKRDTIYEDLGHAEVVQLDLTSNPEKEMEMFANTYFKQFRKTR